MDCVEFLESLLEQPELKHNVGLILSDSPFNSLRESGRLNICADDILEVDTCERICVKIKALLHPEGKVYSPTLPGCEQFCYRWGGLGARV